MGLGFGPIFKTKLRSRFHLQVYCIDPNKIWVQVHGFNSETQLYNKFEFHWNMGQVQIFKLSSRMGYGLILPFWSGYTVYQTDLT